MAKDPKDNAERYGLSPDVAADLEPVEGPPLGGQGGENRTKAPEHARHRDHGPKTRARAKEIINGRP
jgi:hypothetical protein